MSFLSDLAAAVQRYASLEPQEILAEAQKKFAEGLAISFSGAEDVVLIDMAAKNKAPFRVFCLDTGRLHEETYTLIDQVREHYGIALEVYTPNPQLLEPFIHKKGLNSFYRNGHKECCSIRKVEPLQRALAGCKAWAAGLRRDQNPATRGTLAAVELDENHHSPDGQPLVKFSPLLEWSSRQVWNYIRENNVPYNKLHDMGFISIGCAPCTRPARPGEHERMSRWWWEEAAQRECGLHKP
ncbi:MAG: phosphoadenosine phosphosulfate reductase [Spirochaeta sp. LUC14_002_19_P3]|nr:MAG: phosphoadenosine phosphosulfate reductase [Spirochaeta sp. LUC14_002_19_P3]